MSNWRKFWDLSAADRADFVQAMSLLVAVHAVLRLFGFDRCRSVLARLSPLRTDPGEVGTSDRRRALVIASLVRAAGRHGPTDVNCLRESLVLWFMLRRRGILCQIRIGVRKPTGELEAHAWVECGDRVVNDTSDVSGRFAPFERAVSGV